MINEEQYYQDLKYKLIDLEISKKINQVYDNYSELKQRYNIGKMLVEAQGGEKRAKYGDGLIKRFSERLTKELGKGYSTRNLKNMRKFYLFRKGQTLSALSWSHYIVLLQLKEIDKIKYYINQIINF